jgi:hypothetical protein
MLGELKMLLNDIQKLYDSLKHDFVFSNLEHNIKVTISPTITGQIILKGILRNDDFTGEIDFEITTDQSYLPETIAQLKNTLKDLNKTI